MEISIKISHVIWTVAGLGAMFLAGFLILWKPHNERWLKQSAEKYEELYAGGFRIDAGTLLRSLKSKCPDEWLVHEVPVEVLPIMDQFQGRYLILDCEPSTSLEVECGGGLYRPFGILITTDTQVVEAKQVDYYTVPTADENVFLFYKRYD